MQLLSLKKTDRSARSPERPPLRVEVLEQRLVLSGFSYAAEQHGVETAVSPLQGITNVVDFYDYNNVPASANTGLEQSDTSIIFLYEAPDETISLVMIHDEPFDGTGGAARFTFDGVPLGTSFVVRDEPFEPALPVSTWAWLSCCTDGGALSGTLNQTFEIRISAVFSRAFGGEIDEWVFLTGDINSPTEIPLDKDTDLIIHARHTVIIDIKPGSDPNSVNLKSKGVVPVAVISTADFDATTIDPADLLFGDPVLTGRVSPVRSAIEDVDNDGDDDLVLFFSTRQIVANEALNSDSVDAVLFGDGIFGTDAVNIVPKK